MELKAFDLKKEVESESLSDDSSNSPNLNSFRHSNFVKYVTKYSKAFGH